MSGTLRTLAATAALAAGLAAGAAQATVLTFDVDNSKPNVSVAMPQAYGDRVTAAVQGGASYGVGAEGFTGNVVVDYAGSPQTSLIRWPTAYGDLTNVLENETDGASYIDLTFTADAGFQVVLFGFDLAGWPSKDYALPGGVRVTSGANTLFSQSNVLVQGDTIGPRHTAFDFGAGLTGQSLTLRIDLTGLANNSDNIGLDNVRFGQVGGPAAVPEPATWALMILGMAGAGAALRQRRRWASAG